LCGWREVLEGEFMCDIQKYSDLFQEIKKLEPDDTMQLVLESKTEEERNFYELVGDFLLQSRQKEAIARNVY
jgi:chaperonin cofactor prefoldin